MNDWTRTTRKLTVTSLVAAATCVASACGGSVSDDQATVVLVEDSSTTTSAGEESAAEDSMVDATTNDTEAAAADPTTTSTAITTSTAVPQADLVERAVDTGQKCNFGIYSPGWILDDEIEILGETYTGPICRIGKGSSAIEFDLGNQFSSASVSVGVDEGGWPIGDFPSSSDALYEVHFLEISGSTERVLHPMVEVSLGEPVTVEVDVTDVARLHVRIDFVSGGNGNVSVYDGELLA